MVAPTTLTRIVKVRILIPLPQQKTLKPLRYNITKEKIKYVEDVKNG